MCFIYPRYGSGCSVISTSRRWMCTVPNPQAQAQAQASATSTYSKAFPKSLLIGITMGIFGGTVGLGGGVVAVPLQTLILSLTPHQAIGTSSFAVVATGYGILCDSFTDTLKHSLLGSLTYWVYGSGKNSVDIPAGLLLGACSMLTARQGAIVASKTSSTKLRNMLALFMVSVIPAVVAKPYIQHYLPESEKRQGSMINDPKAAAALVVIGGATGFASGLFGVGGGIIMVPLLGILSNQQMANGTSLFAMTAPSIVSAATHHKLNNVNFKVLPGLAIGSCLGVWIGGRFATSLTETQQRGVFAGVMSVLAVYMRFKAK